MANTIVAIHGAPRSGTSWLGQLFNSSPATAYRYQPFFAHAFRGRVDDGSDKRALQAFFADLLATDDDFVHQSGSRRLAAEETAFEKGTASHLVYKEVRFHHMLPRLLALLPNVKGIGIVRDPRTVLASWARAPREFDRSWSLADEWRHANLKNAGLEENWYGFDRWKQLAGMFLQLEAACPNRFRLVRYEDLVADPSASMADLFDFCGLEMGIQTRNFIDRSTTRDDGDPYGVFRAHDRREATPVDPGIAGAIEAELEGTDLSRFLLAHHGR